MPKEGERALQYDLFTGELIDNRTAGQKKRSKEAEKPQQELMFSQREMAQFGVNPHPQIPLSDQTTLGLLFEDHRTEDEKVADIQQQALKNNLRMFEEEAIDQDEVEETQTRYTQAATTKTDDHVRKLHQVQPNSHQ